MMILPILLVMLFTEVSGRMKMGARAHCDDGHTKLDKDFTCAEFMCNGRQIKGAVKNIIVKKHMKEKDYGNDHACMDKTLSYNVTIPSSGTHRPAWPKYGEYPYVPPQRWIHSLEHGAIVFLYNPCLERSQVELLRKETQRMARKRKHLFIMTRYNLPADMPIALVAWRANVQLNGVDSAAIREFIKAKYNQGLEKVSKDGQYNYLQGKKEIPVEFIEFCRMMNVQSQFVQQYPYNLI